MTTDTQKFLQAMKMFGLDKESPRIAVAVSGGGDSVALALLMHDWARAQDGKILALTVDHALRPGSGNEARRVQALMARLGIAHEILTWGGTKPATHIQEEARKARYRLLLAECGKREIPVLALAHNLEDQAETFWMRLAHGSGLDGLAGMAAARAENGINIIRPVLGFTRAELRAVCTARGVEWIDDPSNENEKFLRVRLRRFEETLAAEGLTPQRLGQTLAKLESAREALDEMTRRALALCAVLHDEGHASLDIAAWRGWPRDIRVRAVAALLRSVYPQDYPPGAEALDDLCAALQTEDFTGRTLAGCDIFPDAGAVVICREASAMEPRKPAAPGVVWDRRFPVTQDADSLDIGALGEEGLRQLKTNPAAHGTIETLPFKVKKTLPALWRGTSLVRLMRKEERQSN